MFRVSTVTVADFKTQFTRGFEYYVNLGCPKDFVLDADITSAYVQAGAQFNEDLFPETDPSVGKLAFMNLAAHCLCIALQASTQGTGSVSFFPAISRSTGPVSEAYSVPRYVSESPILSGYATTRYGQMFLALALPRTVGGVTIATGATTA
jgi:hypothetical protein